MPFLKTDRPHFTCKPEQSALYTWFYSAPHITKFCHAFKLCALTAHGMYRTMRLLIPRQSFCSMDFYLRSRDTLVFQNQWGTSRLLGQLQDLSYWTTQAQQFTVTFFKSWKVLQLLRKHKIYSLHICVNQKKWIGWHSAKNMFGDSKRTLHLFPLLQHQFYQQRSWLTTWKGSSYLYLCYKRTIIREIHGTW